MTLAVKVALNPNTTNQPINDGNVGEQPVAWEEHCAESWLNEFMESMKRCTGRRNMTEIPLKTTFNTIKSINQKYFNHALVKEDFISLLNAFYLTKQYLITNS